MTLRVASQVVVVVLLSGVASLAQVCFIITEGEIGLIIGTEGGREGRTEWRETGGVHTDSRFGVVI